MVWGRWLQALGVNGPWRCCRVPLGWMCASVPERRHSPWAVCGVHGFDSKQKERLNLCHISCKKVLKIGLPGMALISISVFANQSHLHMQIRLQQWLPALFTLNLSAEAGQCLNRGANPRGTVRCDVLGAAVATCSLPRHRGGVYERRSPCCPLAPPCSPSAQAS